ncbi:hypothetical protein [Emticicia sp. SJ17W-69]|uniref:hypothetical protein n=1 Tax=Emticicia sp. SJ17W-69 TaxID=3421657 RepID=UPI003EBE5E51
MKQLFLLIFLCFSSTLFAQEEGGIDFIRGTLENAQKLAEQQHKLVFISYENYGGNSRWMNQNVFSTPEIGEYFNEKFVSLKINSESLRDKASYSNFKYHDASSAYFFFTPDGELIYKSHFAANPQELIADAAKAININENFVSLEKLDKLISKAEASQDILYLHSLRRLQTTNVGSNKEKNLKDLDKTVRNYISGLDKASLAAEKNVLLLCEYLYETNKTCNDELFKLLVGQAANIKNFSEENVIGIEQRIDRIIERSFNQALTNKNVDLMNESISTIATFWHEKNTPFYNKEMAMRSFKIDFYETTKDWENYSKEIAAYLNQIDAIDSEALATNAVTVYKKDEDKQKFTTEEWAFLHDDILNAYNEEIAYQLRLYGWRFAQNITDKESLKLPLKWLSKSLRIAENPTTMKTYSQVLYKLGREQEAKKYAEDAVKVAKGQVIVRDFREADAKNQ